jgi:signal transduction histidine kinase
MFNLRLRTKFLLSLLLVSSAITVGTVWMVGQRVRIEMRKQMAESLRNSVVVFKDFQRQREVSLASSAELLASLPNLKALMTTHDPATIQDASADIWRLAPSDVFVLADPVGQILALHTKTPGMTRTSAEELLKNSLGTDQPSFWWYGAGHLYQVFLQPIYFGTPRNGSILGILGVGHEISQTLASDVGRVATSEVAFFYGNKLIVSTMQPGQETDLTNAIATREDMGSSNGEDVRLADETFLTTTVELAPSIRPFVHLMVLKSYDKATAFIEGLNRMLLGLAVVAVIGGSIVVFLVSYTFTKPLANLVAGLRALEQGDFAYPLNTQGGDEIAELTTAFARMRGSLQRTQQELLVSERLATIGRTASSISHDLRHPLTAIMANAEFLCDKNLDQAEREDLYREIRTGIDHMTDLVESLLEFSQARETLRKVFGPVEEAVERARSAVQAHPEFHRADIQICREGPCETWFDQRKVERALVNLLRNACEFVPADSGKVEVNLREGNDRVEIRIVDNGPGVPEPIRQKLFQPFVSYGKQNGIGLGLAIGQKIFQDHGGDACLESTQPGRTVFRLTLPIVVSEDQVLSN